MSATMVASGTKAVPPLVSSIQDISIAKILESKTNPRRSFDEAKLAELADFGPQLHVKASALLANPGFRSYSRKIRWRVFSGKRQRKTLPCQHRNYLCRLSGWFFLFNSPARVFRWQA